MSGNNTNTTDPGDIFEGQPVEEEFYSSWALLILTTLLIGALWTSYYLQLKQIRAIHETVASIVGGMLVGLAIKLSPGHIIQKMVTFNQGYFFNLLLPPIILNSGYELKRQNFFRNFGTILTFALAGTFITAIMTGIFVFIYAAIGLESLHIGFLDSMIFGSILSATDPVTILAIFSQLKVDPKLYSIIFGESILNDAVAIVLSTTLVEFRGQELHISNIVRGIGMFFGVFLGSLGIGIMFGLSVALMLKHSQLYRYPNIEACLISLMAYSSYLFSNGISMSGIVSLLFCGITLKHYAYDNMSLRSRRTTKYMFQVLAQLSENFIFIYLGVNLFTQTDLVYQPLFIFFTTVAIIIARYCAVFPLSRLINMISRATLGPTEQLTRPHQVMIFWAGLRGAVAFALAGVLTGDSGPAMRTTILAVVVLSVIIFGGTTNTMLAVLDIRTGVDEDSESSSADGSGTDDPDERILAGVARIDRYMDDDDTDDAPGIYGLRTDRGSSYSLHGDQHESLLRNQEVSISGLLSGPIGNPVPEDHTHWFLSFDNRWLKPFFTTPRRETNRGRHRSAYWRRQLRNLKFGSANGAAYNHHTRNNPPQQEFYTDDDDEALGLGAVSGRRFHGTQQQQQQQQQPQLQRFGSGRVFGRVPSQGGGQGAQVGGGRLQLNTGGQEERIGTQGTQGTQGSRSPRSPDEVGRGFDLGLGSLLDS